MNLRPRSASRILLGSLTGTTTSPSRARSAGSSGGVGGVVCRLTNRPFLSLGGGCLAIRLALFPLVLPPLACKFALALFSTLGSHGHAPPFPFTVAAAGAGDVVVDVAAAPWPVPARSCPFALLGLALGLAGTPLLMFPLKALTSMPLLLPLNFHALLRGLLDAMGPSHA
jgi:hypothetical protein